MKRWFGPAFIVILALALALRLPQLNLRPLHNDEAVNAIKFRMLWEENAYKYDKNEFHGPTLPYFTLPFAWFSGSRDFNAFTEATFRRVTVLFSVCLIALLLLLTRDFGIAETLWAAVFMSLSPAMVFYSRYYIHETLLLFFTALAAVALWRYCRSGRIGWVFLSGLSIGLMWATKETFVFSVLSLALAAISAVFWNRWRGDAGLAGAAKWNVKHTVIAAAVALVVGLLFYSSFLANPAGIMDSIKTYAPWLHRAEGVSPHVHPWNFYFARLLFYHAEGGPVFSEGLIAVLAAIGFAASLAGWKLGAANVLLVRVLSFYTVWLTFIYTLLPYKTPWCLIQFFYGMILLAGIGTSVLLRLCAPRVKMVLAVGVLAGAGQLGWQARQENFGFDRGGVPYCDSPKIPYTYSQTVPDMYRLLETVDGLAHASPQAYETPIEVMSQESFWPLPWYLRRFKSAGYWEKIPDQPLAPIMIVSSALNARFDDRPEKTHLMAGYFELRPNVFFELYVNVDLWSRYIKTRPPEKD